MNPRVADPVKLSVDPATRAALGSVCSSSDVQIACSVSSRRGSGYPVSKTWKPRSKLPAVDRVGTHPAADRVARLQHRDAAPGRFEMAGGSQTGQAGTDDDQRPASGTLLRLAAATIDPASVVIHRADIRTASPDA